MIVVSIWEAHNVRQFFKILAFLLVPGAILAAIPASVIFLVTNGDIGLLNVGLVGGWADRIVVGFDFLIPCFLIVVPSLLRRRLAWDQSRPDVQALLPTWLAIYAAAATVGLVITLHFVKGGQLANMPPTLVMAAIVGIVFLLFPFYSLLARACWQRGYLMAFFGWARWCSEQRAAWNVVWTAIRPHGAEAALADRIGADLPTVETSTVQRA